MLSFICFIRVLIFLILSFFLNIDKFFLKQIIRIHLHIFCKYLFRQSHNSLLTYSILMILNNNSYCIKNIKFYQHYKIHSDQLKLSIHYQVLKHTRLNIIYSPLLLVIHSLISFICIYFNIVQNLWHNFCKFNLTIIHS